MQKLDKEDKLQAFFSQDKIAHVNTAGVINLKDEYEIYVDDKEEPSAYLLQKGKWHIINTADTTVNRAAAGMVEEILAEGSPKFSGVLHKFYELIAGKADIEFAETCYLYYMKPENFVYEPPEVAVDSLKVEEAEIVNHYHPYSEDVPEDINRIKKLIENFPAYTVRDREGNPVSWALLRDDGSLGMAHTLKEHRRQGYAYAITIELLQSTIELGLTPYLHIVTDNSPSISLAEDLGFNRYDERVVWFGVEEES